MTTAATPIARGREFYVPFFEVRLAGAALSQNVIRDILSVTYKDDIEKLDSFEITINNWDADKLALKYSDTRLFDPGKKLELFMGYRNEGEPVRMIQGEITSLRPTFPASGTPTLAISGLNLLHRLRVKQESKAYLDKTDNDIAREIADRLGIEIETDPNAPAANRPYQYIIQDNRYDILFLMERARRIGFDLFVEEKGSESKLHFKPTLNIKRVAYELEYGKSLIQFQPNLTTAHQVFEVKVTGWNATKKEKIEATADRSMLRNKGVGANGGQEVIEQAFKQRKEVVANKIFEDKDEADKYALETLENIAKDMIRGSGSTVGLPDLRAGTVLQLKGLGKRFSGRHLTTSTSHTIGDSGYTATFECRREELDPQGGAV